MKHEQVLAARAGAAGGAMEFASDYSEAALDEVRRTRLLIDRLDEWLFEIIDPFLGDRILEVGSGHGNLVRHLLDREHVVATDIEPTAVDVLQNRFGGATNFEAVVVDVADADVLSLQDRRLDTVVSLNVFEHVEHDERAIEHAFRLLQPNGRLVLIVPAHSWLYGAMDSSIGHWRRYDKAMVSKRLIRAGFHVERLRYINSLGTAGWFINGRVLRRTTPPTGQLRLFNRLVPLVARIEDLLEPPIGLSLLAVGGRDLRGS